MDKQMSKWRIFLWLWLFFPYGIYLIIQQQKNKPQSVTDKQINDAKSGSGDTSIGAQEVTSEAIGSSVSENTQNVNPQISEKIETSKNAAKADLFKKCRFLLQIFIDKSGNATFLISGKDDLPDFLKEGIVTSYTSKTPNYRDTIYKPFHSKILGDLNLSKDHPNTGAWSDDDETVGLHASNLIKPDKYAFDFKFFDGISVENIVTLEKLMNREKQSFEETFSEHWDEFCKEYPGLRYYWLPVDTLGEKTLHALLERYPTKESMKDLKKQDLLEISGLGEKKANNLLKYYRNSEKFNAYENDLEFFFNGGANHRMHGNWFVSGNGFGAFDATRIRRSHGVSVTPA